MVDRNFDEQEIRKLIRDEIGKMQVKFYSSKDEKGRIELIGKLVSDEQDFAEPTLQ